MQKFLIIISFVFSLNTYSLDRQIKILKSKGTKHIISVNDGASYKKGDIITITDSDAKTADFKILRVNKTGTKLLIKGKGEVSLQDICSFSCVSRSPNKSLEDEFMSENPVAAVSKNNVANGKSNKTPKKKMKNGFLGLGYSLIRDFTNEIPGIVETTETIDFSLNVFFEKYLFEKDIGTMAIALGGFASANIAAHRGEGLADSVDPIVMIQPTVGVNVNFIPIRFVRVFAGPNINFSAFSEREYFDVDLVDNVTETRDGNIGFGYQVGVRVVPGSFFAELKYQNISTTYDLLVKPSRAIGLTREVESSFRFLTLSIGTTF